MHVLTAHNRYLMWFFDALEGQCPPATAARMEAFAKTPAFRERMAARPAVQTAMKDEGLIK